MINKLSGLQKILSDQLSSAALPWLGSFVFVFLIAQTLAQLTWRVLEPEDDAPPATVATESMVGAATPLDYASRIGGLNLFGESAVKITAEAAPLTQLSLRLSGVIAGTQPAIAIIANEQGDRAYGVGEKIPNGPEVEEIYPDYVLLRGSAGLEKLQMPVPAIISGLTMGADASSRPEQIDPRDLMRDMPEEVFNAD